MKIAIIGAGFTGLTAAYRLAQEGNDITIFEKDQKPGGLALGYKEKGWEWSLEYFYHHWFTNDDSVLGLAKELKYPVLTKRPKTSSLIDNRIYQLDSPSTLLSFSKLSLLERIQMGLVLAFLRYNPFWNLFENITAASFLNKTIGRKAYLILWQPLLVSKFGEYADKIALTWFWSRIKKRTTYLAYPQGGFLHFAQHLADAVLNKGGKIYFQAELNQVKSDGVPSISYTINNQSKIENFDKVIITLPSFAFIKIAPQLPENYKKSLTNLKGIGAVVLVLRFKKKFFADDTYWLNICDTQAPVLAVVEHTNFIDKKHYNNEHLVYLGNYLPNNHRFFTMSEKQIMSEFDNFLTKINPDYKKDLIAIRKFSTPFAQPIFFKNYGKMIPTFTTPLQNIYLANMQQVYPWDRGTNYAVELGEKIARLVTDSH